MSSSHFNEMAQLTSEPTLLGNLLLNMAKSLIPVDQDSKQSMLQILLLANQYCDESWAHAGITVQIELLIRSHDCYTLGCSVDGKK